MSSSGGSPIPSISTPAFANRQLFVGSGDGSLYAVNAATGTIVWSTPVSTKLAGPAQQLQTTPAVADGIVCIGAADGFCYAFAAATGAPVWKTQLVRLDLSNGDSVTMSAPLIAGNVVYIQAIVNDGTYNQNGKLYAIQAQSGKVLWQVDPAKLPLPLRIADMTVIPNTRAAYASGQTIYWTVSFLSTDGNLVGAEAVLGLRQQDGSLQSYFLAPVSGIDQRQGYFPSTPVPVSGGIAFLTNEPTVYVLNT